MTERKSIFQERFTVFEICWDDIIVSGGVFLVILHSLLDKTSFSVKICFNFKVHQFQLLFALVLEYRSCRTLSRALQELG